MKTIVRGLSYVSVALLLALSVTSAQGQQLTGKGEWRSLSSTLIGGTWTSTLVRSGGHVQGTLKLTGSNVLSGGDVSGDIDTSSIMLGVMANGTRQASFTGKLNGASIEGEWSLNCDAVEDQGVWYGTLDLGVPSSDGTVQE